MNRILLAVLLIGLTAMAIGPYAAAEVEGELVQQLALEGAPLDVATSVDGRWLYVLLSEGEVRVYTQDGKFEGRLSVGQGAAAIASSPTGDKLYVTVRNPDRVNVVAVDIVRDIDVAGLPFKGPPDAPVEVAVYDDFQ